MVKFEHEIARRVVSKFENVTKIGSYTSAVSGGVNTFTANTIIMIASGNINKEREAVIRAISNYLERSNGYPPPFRLLEENMDVLEENSSNYATEITKIFLGAVFEVAQERPEIGDLNEGHYIHRMLRWSLYLFNADAVPKVEIQLMTNVTSIIARLRESPDLANQLLATEIAACFTQLNLIYNDPMELRTVTIPYLGENTCSITAFPLNYGILSALYPESPILRIHWGLTGEGTAAHWHDVISRLNKMLESQGIQVRLFNEDDARKNQFDRIYRNLKQDYLRNFPKPHLPLILYDREPDKPISRTLPCFSGEMEGFISGQRVSIFDQQGGFAGGSANARFAARIVTKIIINPQRPIT